MTTELRECIECKRLVTVDRKAFGKGTGIEMQRFYAPHQWNGLGRKTGLPWMNIDFCVASGWPVIERAISI